MKKTHKIISILLVLAMLLTMAPLTAFATEIVASGDCGAEGNNATWTLDSDGLLTVDGTGSLGSYTYSKPAPWNDYLESIKKVIVKEGITSIGNGAFRICENLTEVSLPSTLTSVGQYSFIACSSLIKIDIPDKVTTIGQSAFFNCTALEQVTLSDSLESIGETAFYGCESLTEIHFPNSVTHLDEWAFYGCTALKKATLSNNLKTIPERAFYECSSLEEIIIPDGITTIGERAFEDCFSLAKVSFPNSVTTIGDYAFSTCSSLEEITLPNKLTTLNLGAFRSCAKLVEVTVPPSVTAISATFPFCKSLKEVTIPSSVTSIASDAFEGCYALETVNVPCEWDGTLYTFDSDVKINQHNWINKDGVCADCKYECLHTSHTENICDICGVPHSHSFEYTAGPDGKIVATCVEGGCFLENSNGGTLKILAPADLYTDGTISREATVENNLFDTSVAISEVSYSTADGSAPKTAGTYTASVTAGGATASVEFTLSNYAAKVTDEDGNLIGNYKTPADAVTAAQENENSTLTLLDDITVAKELDIESGKFTLDLNGKNLVSERGRVIESYAVLTIKDSGEGGTIYSKGGGVYAIINRGTLTFESGTVKGDGGIENRGTLTFNNGTVEAGDYSAISNFDMVYVYDGVFRSIKNSGINNYGTAFVYGGESSGVLNEGTAYISGGKFARNGYAVLNLNSGTVEITGGSFSGTDKEDGFFTGVPYGEYTVYYDENATLTLKGGEFPNGFVTNEVNVNPFLAKGYAFHDANGNKITVADDAKKIDGYVQVKDHYIARVTDKDGNEIEGSPFKTLEEAADAVRWDYENATITLLDDITLDSMWRVGGVVTIDLNGKTLNCTSGDTIYVQAFNGFAVTVVDSSENKTGVIRSETGTAIDVGVGSKFILNSGTITAENNYAIKAAYRERNHSLLEVNGGTVNGVVICYADSVVSGGTFNDMFAISYNYKQNKFSGGIFNGGIKITSFDPLNDILADGYHFRNAQGKVVDGSSEIIEEKVTIEKGADFSADAVVTAEDVVYNGAAQEPDVTVTIGGKPLTEGKDYTIAFADNINAGTATVTVTSAGDYEGEIVKTFEIKKADSSIDVYPKANKLTYNGEAQTLVVIGDTYDGMIVYSLDGEKYSPLAPTGTNAGEYTVYYKVEGNSNHNDTEPETLTVTIGKKSVTASATVPDKIYDGTTTVDSSAINITLEGIIDGDDVVIEKCLGMFLSTNVGNNKKIQIAYWVSGEDVNNYEIYEDYISVPEAEYYFIETKANILPRDIANAQIVLGDALTYNGAEQTQSISGVTVDGLEVTYTVSGNTATNVGVYELTITGNGNFTGETNALYEVAPDTSTIDALTVDNVKSSDKEAIESVAKQIENAVTDLAGDEKKAEYKAIADKCNELLAKIDATADEIARIDEAVNSYDKETVTSADIPEISKLIDDIKALADGNNITEDEKSALEENNEAIDELIEKLTEVAEEIKSVDEAVKSYDEETVKSTDKADLEQLKEDIQALIDSTNTTENEKTALGEMIKNIEGLEDKVEEIENQLEEIKGVENNFNPETVTSEDKTAIEEKIAEIESVNPDNLTEEQKAEYDEIKAGFEALLEEIEKAGSEVDAIGAELEMFDEEKATIFWEDEIEALKAKIDELLADENMGEAEKAKLEEYKAQCDNLIMIINTPAKYLSMRLFYFIWDALHWLSSHVVFIFNWIVSM